MDLENFCGVLSKKKKKKKIYQSDKPFVQTSYDSGVSIYGITYGNESLSNLTEIESIVKCI